MPEGPDILIVDDTAAHIDLAAGILAPLGYPIRACADSGMALALMGENPPAVLLLDVQMPGRSGFDLLEDIGKTPALAEVAVLLVTVRGEEADIQRGFALGARDYVQKPYLASELSARVETHMHLVCRERELRAAHDELEQFCHTVSHDLKSPLLVIRQLAGLLTAEPDLRPEDTAEICRKLSDRTGDVIAMLDRLLELSRVGDISGQLTRVALGPVAEEVFAEQAALCPGRRIRLELGPLPTVTGEPSLLRLLFQNIIGNAVKFTRGREEAVIRIGSRAEAGGACVFVEDNGVGFDMRYRDRLFGIFERLHGGDYAGSGVGLAIVDRIMRRHGGTSDIRGEPDKGCTVFLYFPQKEESKGAD